MTLSEAVYWINTIGHEISKEQYRSLWRYQQKLFEIKKLLERTVVQLDDIEGRIGEIKK